jgi:predicted transcriptional regulator
MTQPLRAKMSEPIKFTSQMPPELIERLSQIKRESGRSLSWLITEAVRQYIQKETTK